MFELLNDQILALSLKTYLTLYICETLHSIT